jgi:CRP-like cAMP-binding protein
MTSAPALFSNRILSTLSAAELQLLEPNLERVPLRARDVLQEPGTTLEYAWFPESGMISLVLPLSDGRTVEVAAVGIEGVAGHTIALGAYTTRLEIIAQVPGEAVRLPRGALLEALPSCPQLRELVERFGDLMLNVAAQNVACGQMHQLSERLARWLLTVKDLTGSPRFSLTQEFMAEMLGTNRPTVTLSALTLSNAGLVRYSRGRIEIVDEQGLEDSACECYRALRTQYARLGSA